MNNEFLDLIKERRSCRNFKKEQIRKKELEAIVEAGQYAPNAGGTESWHFTVIQNKEMLERINHLAKEGGKASGIPHLKSLGENEAFHSQYNAPTLIIVSGDENSIVPEQDCAAATQNIMLAAESLDVASCWIYFTLMSFHSEEGAKLREELKIPAGFKPITSIVLGYRKSKKPKAAKRKPDTITYID